jgi:ferredoxin
MQVIYKKLRPVISKFGSRCGVIRRHGGPSIPADAPTIQFTFVNPHPSQTKKGEPLEKLVVQARIGETLLQTAHRNDVDLEGACEGVCACSTCHLIFQQDVFDHIPEPSEDEEDMLGRLSFERMRNDFRMLSNSQAFV